jgi:hypothetical protein
VFHGTVLLALGRAGWEVDEGSGDDGGVSREVENMLGIGNGPWEFGVVGW